MSFVPNEPVVRFLYNKSYFMKTDLVESPILSEDFKTDVYSDSFLPSDLSLQSYTSLINRQVIVSYRVPSFVSRKFHHAVEMILQRYQRVSGFEPVDPLDILSRMDLGTSPGFPWNQLPGINTKKALLCSQWSEIFWSWLLEFPKALNDGGTCSIWNVFPKIELREKAKVLSHQTRGITGCDFVVTFWTCYLFGNMCDETYTHVFDHDFPSCIGINPFLGGWNKLHAKLFRLGSQHSVSTDVKNFDGSVRAFLLSSTMRIRASLGSFDPGHLRLLLHLYDDLMYSWCFIFSDDGSARIIENGVTTGSPQRSGSPLTATNNELIHEIAQEYSLFDAPIPNCGHLAYSDDGVYECPSANIHFFENRLAPSFLELGFILKSPYPTFVRPASDAEFLSATWVDWDGIYIYCSTRGLKFKVSSFYSTPSGDVVSTFSKLCALRLLSLPCDYDLFKLIDQEAKLLLKKFPIDLGPHKRALKTEIQLRSLYSGREVLSYAV